MEPTFYEEHSYDGNNPREALKRNMTLDLNGRNGKMFKLNPAVTGAPVLSSPDLNMLKLGSPELERLIIDQQNGIGGNSGLPTQILFPKNVTEEQEIYARGFVEALNELHHSDSSQSGMQHAEASSDSSVMAYHPLETHYRPNYAFAVSPPGSSIKEEPQTVPDSPPVSPLDMECQEKIKLERKRYRNRVAASKCRKRKLERIALLEGKVKMLKSENAELSQSVSSLRERVYRLKQELMQHVQCGCNVVFAPHHQQQA